jgi:hypothetical protein
MGQTIVTVITDFLVYVLPMPTLWQVQLPLMQRISLMILFGFGSIVVVAGCMRAYWVWFVEYQTYDVTWYGFYLWIWAAVEANLGVICGCIPVLKPLVWRSSKTASQYGKSAGQSSPTTSQGWMSSAKRRRERGSNLDLTTDEGYVNLDLAEKGKTTTEVTAGNGHNPTFIPGNESYELPQITRETYVQRNRQSQMSEDEGSAAQLSWIRD